ncbi:MAG TPA: hypothetical protein VKP66_00870 [Steroidobacteraceae bacterium]|nr:hypothetical protein [Steroidobacteraceae bacterium]
MGICGVSAVSLAVMCILGCSSHQNPDAPPPSPKTVFDPLTQQISRAKDVQNTVDANTENTRKAVDGQERGDSQP